jgi:hypothetical protein
VNRGDVYLIELRLPRRPGPGTELRDKLVVALQGGPIFGIATEVAVLIASSHRGGVLRPFEVLVGVPEGFHHDTVIDARWPMTLPKSQVLGGTYVATLSADVMWQVSRAIAAGLQMRPPGGAAPVPVSR